MPDKRAIGGLGIYSCIFLFSILTFLNGKTCLSQPKDITGWGRTKWGMTEKEVMKAMGKSASHLLPNEQRAQQGSYVPILGDPVTIGGNQFHPEFVFDEGTKRLRAVVLRCERTTDLSTDDFNKMEELLVAKYGITRLTNFQHGTGSLKKESAWTFRSGSVRLVLIDWGTGMQLLFVKYAVESPGKDKL